MQRRRFDQEWRFHLGDIAEGRWREPDDSTWRLVDLSHDWSIELERDPANPSGSAGGYFPMGLGWYRKTFAAPEAWRGKRVRIEFEGVYMNAEAWLNGHLLGRHPYGYTSFWYDLTPYLDVGATNVLKVMVDNACQVNSRWYSGSGIYRHVWLMVAEPVHVGQWGIYVTTPEVSPEGALVRVRTTVENEAEGTHEVIIRSRIVAADSAWVSSHGTPHWRGGLAWGACLRLHYESALEQVLVAGGLADHDLELPRLDYRLQVPVHQRQPLVGHFQSHRHLLPRLQLHPLERFQFHDRRGH